MTPAADQDDGWDASAEAWIADMGTRGDFAREFVLDPAMLPRLRAGGFRNALDIGCGEGRLCRAMAAMGIAATGIDPTGRLLAEARARHPEGDYRAGRAEALDLPDASFDLVLSCLSLIDIPDHCAAIAEMARVLAPGGTLMIANLNPFITAMAEDGWHRGPDGTRLHYRLDRYRDAGPRRVSWRGIDIVNHHRPMESYMAALIAAGLTLTHFEEPRAIGGPAERRARYNRVPWFHLMEWRRPV